MERNDLALRNLGLVGSMIHRLRSLDPRIANEVEWDDHFQIGAIALLQAAERWQPDKGPFQPYANTCIFKQLWGHVRQCRRLAIATVEINEDDAARDRPDQERFDYLVSLAQHERTRRALRLHYAEGHTLDEIAAAEGASNRQNVHYWIKTGLRQIREALEIENRVAA